MSAPQSVLEQLDAAVPPPLAQPAVFDLYLFEEPWTAVIVLLGVALVLFAVLSTRGQPRKARIAAGIGAFASTCVVGIATWIDTPREQMKALAVDLVQLVVAADGPGVRGRLTPDAVLLTRVSADGTGVDQIVERVVRDMAVGGVYAVRAHAVLEVQAAMSTPTRGIVQIKVRVTPAAMPYPVPSWWRMDFERATEQGEWKVSGIQLLSIGGGLGRGGSGGQ